MGRSHHPIRTTIFFGLLCGISFIPLNLALNYILQGPSVNYLILWLYAAGYSLLLGRWSKTSIRSIGFPLGLHLAASIQVDATAVFYLISLAIISWIRSGICFKNPSALQWALELLFCTFGGILVMVFTPDSPFSWILATWMFFLIQSLFFVIFENRAIIPQDQSEIDPFERASRAAESVLSRPN
jgi:hypothetical protein